MGPPMSPSWRKPLVVSIQSAYGPSSANPEALDAASGMASASQRSLTGKGPFMAAILSCSAELKQADLGSNHHNGENSSRPTHDLCCFLLRGAGRISFRATPYPR